MEVASKLVVECVLVCEFNESHGKQIIESHPQQSDIIDNQSFGLIAELILPRDELCGKFLALEFRKDYFLMGIPTLIRNRDNDQTYFRSKYIYSVLMLVRKENFLADRQTYYEMVRKVSYFFSVLEQEKHVLYNLNRSCIKQLLKTMYLDFNFKKECFLESGCQHFTFVSAKSPIKLSSIVIKPEQVPITNLTDTDIELVEIPEIHQILREVSKGEECVKKIALTLGRPLIEVTDYLKIAVSYGMVTLVDLFNVKNVYVLTDKIHELAKSERQLVRMKEYCKKQETARPTPQELLQVVLLFNRSSTVEDIFRNHLRLFEKVISLVKLIRFCVIRGILKRCHEVLMPTGGSHTRRFFDRQAYMKFFKTIRDTHKQFEQTDNSLENNILQKNEGLNKMVRQQATLDEVEVYLFLSREVVLQILQDQGIETVLCS